MTLAVKGPKIDLLGSPVTWAQSFIGRVSATEDNDQAEVAAGPTSEGFHTPPVSDRGLVTTGEDDDREFCSSEPTPRPFPHSNRRSERVARQKRDWLAGRTTHL